MTESASPPTVLVTATTEVVRGRSRVRVNEAYTQALLEAGLLPLVIPPLAPEVAVQALSQAGGLVLTGGEDVDPAYFGADRHAATGEPNAARDAYELALARAAAERGVPTLAICRGAQVVNVALGGTLVQDIPSELETPLSHDRSDEREQRVHAVRVDAGSMLAGAIGAIDITTNSSHHQSIAAVAPGLRVTARAPDQVIEGLESTADTWWMLAVQWHPEELTHTREDWDRKLFAAFADYVSRRQRASSRT